MKRKHSGNIVIHHFWCENTWWLRLIWFFFQISKTKWNEADQTRWRSHLIALHTHTPLPAVNCPLRLQEWTLWWIDGGQCSCRWWWFIEWFTWCFCQFCSHSCKNSHPQTHISYTNTHKKCFAHRFFHTPNKPGYQKTIHGPLSSGILQNSLGCGESSDVSCTLKGKAERRYWLMPSSIYGTKKHKADTELPPRDFWRS